jgi:hypothetical protein
MVNITELEKENRELKKELEKFKNLKLDTIKKVIVLSSKMADILNRCRYERINVELAKKIDNILEEIKILDEL